MSALVGRSVLPAEVQAQLLERAGGNPLYAEEFARLLTDRDLLTGGRLAAAPEIPVPETVHGLIAARLDMLPAAARALVQDAAVVGRVFWPGAVAAMGEAGADAVEAGLEELERKRLVRRVSVSSVEHQAEYAFWHALVRDVAYAQIPRTGRARRHRAAAEWLQAVAGERVGDLAEVVAHHYGQALAYARAAGEPEAALARLVEPARRFLVLAGDRTSNLDLDRARGYYRQAIDLGPADDPERPHLLARSGRVAFQAGELAEAAAFYEQAIAGLRAQGDARALGAAMSRLATVRWNQGDTRGATAGLATCQEGADCAERRGLGQLAMWVRASSMGPLLDLGRWDEVLALADEAIAWDHAHGGDYLAVGCQRYVTMVLAWRGDLSGARALAAEVLPKARGIDDLQQLVPALVDAALVEQALGDHAAALALAEEAVQITADRAGGHRFRATTWPTWSA